MRLIDADALPKLLDAEYKQTMKLIREGEKHIDTLAEGFAEAMHIAKYIAPTVDAVPVVRGSGSGKPMVESVQPLTAQAAPKPMTNGDRIRAMTAEELAERERRERLYAETRQIADRRAWDETSRTMAGSCGQEANDGQ